MPYNIKHYAHFNNFFLTLCLFFYYLFSRSFSSRISWVCLFFVLAIFHRDTYTNTMPGYLLTGHSLLAVFPLFQSLYQHFKCGNHRRTPPPAYPPTTSNEGRGDSGTPKQILGQNKFPKAQQLTRRELFW